MAEHGSDRRTLPIMRWLPVMLWVLVGGGCCALVSGLEPNLLEEGIELHIAQRLAQGELLYRDVLVFTGPFPFELLASLFRIFGEEIWVARSVVVLFHALATGAAFALARGTRSDALAHAAAGQTASAPLLLFPLFGIYYYTTIAFHLSLIAAWAAWRGIDRARWAVLAGALVAAIALCKQTIGLSLAVALGLGLLLAAPAPRRRRALFGFACGGAGAAVLTIAAWAAAGTLDEAIYGLVSLPASLEASFDLPLINLWPPGELSPAAAGSQTFYLPYYYVLFQGILVEPTWRAILATQLLFALPLFAVAATAVHFFVARPSAAFVLQSALCIGWLSNLVPRTDWGHLAHVLPLLTAQLCIAAPLALQPTRWQRVGVRLGAAFVLFWLVAGSASLQRIIDRIADPGPLSARVPLRPVSSPLRGGHVRSVIEFLETHTKPGEFIFVPRAEPLIYFATGTRNPTPYPGVFPAIREEQQRTILDALEHVRFVVMSDVDQPAMTYYRDELPEVQAYLERFFQPAAPFQDGEIHWLSVLERGADRGATEVDLVALAASGRTFTRDREGKVEAAPALPERLATRRNRRLLGFKLGAGGGGVDFEIDVPERAAFQADASLGSAFSESEIFTVPPHSRILVSIGRAGELAPIAEVTLGAGNSQRWIPLEADLAAWAGQRMTLRLELLRPDTFALTKSVQIGYLGSPRLVRRPGPEAPGVRPDG
jgi:hypothetical protein